MTSQSLIFSMIMLGNVSIVSSERAREGDTIRALYDTTQHSHMMTWLDWHVDLLPAFGFFVSGVQVFCIFQNNTGRGGGFMKGGRKLQTALLWR